MDALLHVETLNQQMATAQESLRQIEDKWNGSQAELLQEDAKYKRIYAQLKQQRDTLAQSLPPADLKYYEDLRTRKAGIAISPLQNGQCGVCHILVPTGVVSAARSRKSEAVTCPSCGRVRLQVDRTFSWRGALADKWQVARVWPPVVDADDRRTGAAAIVVVEHEHPRRRVERIAAGSTVTPTTVSGRSKYIGAKAFGAENDRAGRAGS